MLSGSLNDPEGGDKNGGGNGLGVLLAKSPIPVSKQNGSFGKTDGSSLPSSSSGSGGGGSSEEDAEEVDSVVVATVSAAIVSLLSVEYCNGAAVRNVAR